MNEITFVNLTPHAINLYDHMGQHLLQSWPSTGVARLPTCDIGGTVETVAGTGIIVPIACRQYGKPENLPLPKAFVRYIVSLPFLREAPERTDLVAPDTDLKMIVKDDKGQMIGVKGFVKLYREDDDGTRTTSGSESHPIQ